MFYSIENYKFLKMFIDNADIIKNEFYSALKKDPNLDIAFRSYILDKYSHYWVEENGLHTEQIGYSLRPTDDSPTAIAIYKKGYTLNNFNIPELFPVLTEMLKTVPNLHYASFFKISPLSTIARHAHTRRHLIFHVLINDLENGVCKMTCGDSERIIKNVGDTVLFDYSVEHGSINEATNERINFVIDFNPFIED